jgi:oxygen-independent coproporphyrinogen-3 oxidase
VPLQHRDTAPLLQALRSELHDYHLDSITTAYVGGGSPTSLPQPALGKLIQEIAQACPPLQEFTVECNPGETPRSRLEQILSLGVNRLSFGVQSFHPGELQALGRAQRPEHAYQAVQDALSLRCRNVSVDLIFAIPGSNLAAWKENLTRAIDLGVAHLSAYSLSYESGTPLETARQTGAVKAIDEETDRAMYEMAIEMLTSAGYEHYEISNFALPGYACRHNLGYWHNRPFLGIGPGAASYWQGIRRQNIADIETYCDQITTGQRPWHEEIRTSATDALCETAVLGLRTRKGIDLGCFLQQTGADFWNTFGKVAMVHIQRGSLELRDNSVRLTQQALPIADTVLCDFAAI